MRALTALAVAALLGLAPAARATLAPVPPPEARPGARVALVGGYAGVLALSAGVGPQGRVYVLPLGAPAPPQLKLDDEVRVSPGGSPFGLGLPEPLDLVWWSPAAPGGPSFVAAAFSGLKSGGVLRILPAPPEDAQRIAAEALKVGFVPMAVPPGAPAQAFRKP